MTIGKAIRRVEMQTFDSQPSRCGLWYRLRIREAVGEYCAVILMEFEKAAGDLELGFRSSELS